MTRLSLASLLIFLSAAGCWPPASARPRPRRARRHRRRRTGGCRDATPALQDVVEHHPRYIIGISYPPVGHEVSRAWPRRCRRYADAARKPN